MTCATLKKGKDKGKNKSAPRNLVHQTEEAMRQQEILHLNYMSGRKAVSNSKDKLAGISDTHSWFLKVCSTITRSMRQSGENV